MDQKLKERVECVTHPLKGSYLLGLKLSRLSRGAFSQYPSIPMQVTLFLLNRCNLRCPYCGFFGEANLWGEAKRAFFSKGHLENLLRGLRPPTEFLLTGGEPLLHPDLPAILKRVKEAKHTVRVFTNGLLLHRAAEALRKYADRLCISLDGGTASSHNALRGEGTWETLCAELEQFYGSQGGEARVLRRESKSGARPLPELTFHLTLHPANLEDLAALPNFLTSLLERGVPVGHIQLQHLFAAPEAWQKVQGEAYQHFFGFAPSRSTLPFYRVAMPVSALRQILEELKEKLPVASSYFPQLRLSELDAFYATDEIPERYRRTCTAAHTQLVVLPNGDVEVCPDYPIGSLEDSDAHSLLSSSRLKELKQVLASGTLFPFCKTCCHLYKW